MFQMLIWKRAISVVTPIYLWDLLGQQNYLQAELKNMNSFKAVEKALTYEVNRQTKLKRK